MLASVLSPSTYMDLMSTGISDVEKFVEYAEKKLDGNLDTIISELLKNSTRGLIASYGVSDEYEQIDVLAECGFPTIGWENFIETAIASLGISTMVTAFITDKTDYSYMTNEGFEQHCLSYDKGVDSTYLRFFAFLVNKYGSGCSYEDFVVKHHPHSIPMSVHQNTLQLISRFCVTKPEWVFDTLLSIGDVSATNFDENVAHVRDLIRNGVK